MLQWLAAVGAVVCRQLGFPSSHPNPAQWRLQQTAAATAGELTVQCGGSEENLGQCEVTPGAYIAGR